MKSAIRTVLSRMMDDGVSVSDLADTARCSESHIYGVCSGSQTLRAEEYLRIANKYESDPYRDLRLANLAVLIITLTAPWWPTMTYSTTKTTETQGRFLSDYHRAPCPQCPHVQVLEQEHERDHQVVGGCANCGNLIVSEIRKQDKQPA